ncbi:hypothetical protein D3C87_1306730 [compost metagenome]
MDAPGPQTEESVPEKHSYDNKFLRILFLSWKDLSNPARRRFLSPTLALKLCKNSLLVLGSKAKQSYESLAVDAEVFFRQQT